MARPSSKPDDNFHDENQQRKDKYLLHQEGMGQREIFRRLGLSRNTVPTVIEQQGQVVRAIRKDKQAIDPDLFRRRPRSVRPCATHA